MPQLEVQGKVVELNEQGFLLRQEEWNEDVARALGVLEQIPELSDAHWKVIYTLREYYQQFRIAPMYRKLAKDSGVSLDELEALFSCKTARTACKVAGLPKPAGCL
ncbi:MAG: TusE/DsrC/DsvC family sulfur relay protein [Desulfuromonadales bacterium]|nr:TusE/DsrC/DsvC family sulfur relay protein [Desulfuromonadales bacterium]